MRMKKIIFFSMVLAVFAGCEKENAGEIKRQFYLNAELNPSDNQGVFPLWTRGDQTIFRFSLIHPEERNIADDELTEHFWIEVPKEMSSFQIDEPISGESEIEVYYTRACYCYIPEGYEFTKLIVSGKKVSNDQWNVSFEMRAEGSYGTYELKDSGIYHQDTFSWE